MATLRVASINAKNNPFAVRFMARRRPGPGGKKRPDVIAPQEVYRIVGRLGTLFSGYRSTGFLSGAKDMRRGSKDNPVLVRKRLVNRGELTIQASEASTPEKIAPDRFLQVSAFEHGVGKTAVINIHPHAVTTGRRRTIDRVDETAEFVATLARTINYWRGEGYHVIVLGDANWRANANSPGWRDIAEMFRALGMEYRFQGIDVVAWTPGLKLAKFRTFAKKRVRSDHPGLLADFTRA